MKIFIFMILSCSLVFGQKVRLASLEWPPYSGENLPEYGLCIHIAKKAFLAMGHTLEVDFFPWNRTVALAQTDNSYDGYIPEYLSNRLEENCYFSNSIGESTLGLVETKQNPISWTVTADLQQYKVGVVQGYVNTEEFDQMVEAGLISTDNSINDLQNIKKVAYGRVDVAVIDKYVFEYFLSCDETTKLCEDSLQFNPRPLQKKSLHICFQKTKSGQKLVKIFNEGLEKIDIEKITNDYFHGLNSRKN